MLPSNDIATCMYYKGVCQGNCDVYGVSGFINLFFFNSSVVGVDNQFLVYRITVDSVDPYTWQTASRGDVIIQLWLHKHTH